MAGPFALLATSFTVPTKPSFPLLRLCVLRLPLLLGVVRFAVEPLERFEPLLERAEALRDDLLRDDPLRDDPLRDVLGLAPDELARAVLFDAARPEPELLDAAPLEPELFDADPFDDPLLRCLLLDAFLAANAPSLFARDHTCE
jgi:hypothetical protein